MASSDESGKVTIMFSRGQFRTAALVLAGCSCLPACDAQVDPDYRGEPLASIRGSVNGMGPAGADVALLWFTGTEQNECAGPGLSCSAGFSGDETTDFACAEACGDPESCQDEDLDAWVSCVDACNGVADTEVSTVWEFCAAGVQGQEVTVEGMFPARFTLDIYEPPPAGTLLTSRQGGGPVALGWIVAGEGGGPPINFELGGFDQPKGVIGVSETHVLVYADEAVAADSPWGRFLGGAYEKGFHVLEIVDAGDSDRLKPSSDDLDTEITGTLGEFSELDWPAL